MPDTPEHKDPEVPITNAADDGAPEGFPQVTQGGAPEDHEPDGPEGDEPDSAESEGDEPDGDELEGEEPGGDWPDGERPEGDRIAKLLARAGIASRRDVERMIGEGRVRLHNELVTTPATILRTLRGVTVDGQPVRAAEAARLFAFHKPAGLLTAERDPAGRPTIYTALRNALPPETPRVMPVGRLDLNTEGLLLLTNDGELKRKLELPSTGIPRTYRARTFGDISQNRLEELIEGIEIDGVHYAGIDANMERRTGRNQWIELTLTEGKNREVRRVLEHLGLEVSRLLRVAYGPFYLADLPRGAAVEIAPSQVEKFRVELGMPPSRAASERPPARMAGRAATGRTPAAGSGVAKARPKPALKRRKTDPSRPDEAIGRRTGGHDRSGPRERAEPRDTAPPRAAAGPRVHVHGRAPPRDVTAPSDRPAPHDRAAPVGRTAPEPRGGRSDRTGPRERTYERAYERSGPRERTGPGDRPASPERKIRERPEPRDGAERKPRAAPRDWARTNDRKAPAKRAAPGSRTDGGTNAGERRAARERVAPGTLTSRPRDPDRPRNSDRPRDTERPRDTDRRAPARSPRSGDSGGKAPFGGGRTGNGPAGKGPTGKGPPRSGAPGKGPPRKGPRP